MPKLNSLQDVLTSARTAMPETVNDVMRQIYPAIVELALTEVEAEQVFAALKEASGASLGALRRDFATYMRATGQSAERDSVGTVIVKLALESGLEMWHDPKGDPWATLRHSGHAEHHPLKTKAVKRYLAYLYYSEHGSALHAQGLQDALGTLEARATYEGKEYPTFVRLAEVDGVLYLDLANANWQVVRVSPQGWEIVEADDVPVRFRRPPGVAALPMPQPGGSLAELAELLNVSLDSRDWKLIVAFLLQSLRGIGPYPVLVLTGGQGSGKSTAAKILRALLDPNVSPLRSLSRDERDLFISAMNGWVLAFDNISGLSGKMSDDLCRLSTGGGLSVRALYSDADETLLEAMRPVVLNGITDFVDRHDLVDRALQVHLPSISKTVRKPEKELWAAFDAAQPRILGALLDTVVSGLQQLPTTKLDSLPRLADFGIWATACEAHLGWPQGAFMAAYQNAQDDLIKDALEAEPVAAALLTLLTLKDVPEWTGTAAELLAELNAYNYPEGRRTPKGWPGGPQVLAGVLKRVAPALLAQGFEVTQLSRQGKQGTKRWQLRTAEVAERQKETPKAENGVQHDPFSTDARAVATSPADAPSPGKANLASAETTRVDRESALSDAADALEPVPSK